MRESRFPLQWPAGQQRTRSFDRASSTRFKVTWDDALRDLEREVDLMGGVNDLVSSWLEIGRRGRPLGGKARMKIEDPGVALYFTKDGRRMCVAIDGYDTPLGNLRAIGLTLKAMRDIERHGGKQVMTTAMRGFEALPSDEMWWLTLGVDRHADISEIRAAWREKMKETHPDRGGKAELAARLNEAWVKAQAEKVG